VADGGEPAIAGEIPIGERTVLEPGKSYSVVGTPIVVTLESTSYPLVRDEKGEYRHRTAASFLARQPGEELRFEPMSGEAFTFHGLRVDYQVVGQLSYSRPFPIGVTVRREGDASVPSDDAR